jgi:malate dehydrogenase (oxaloacetate-decarboxylating)
MDEQPLEVRRSGYELLNDPILNKGIAFSEAERDSFGLHGLLPPHIGSLDEQVSRRLNALRSLSNDLERYDALRDMQDNNETAFYSLLTRHLTEALPLVYTPTVGLGCQRFSQIYRKPRGLFLSVPNQHRLASILADRRFDEVTAIVVTDGERILGLGDLGVGGMGIPVGKLSLYSACGGLHPSTTLPLVLDVGTNNDECLSDPAYLGWRHERVRGARYDEFVEAFVTAVTERWPHVLLQWEDFALDNATRLLERYRNRLCTFNDDIQGTATAALGTLLAAAEVTGLPLTAQRVAILGAGSAGCGIATLLIQAMVAAGLERSDACSRIFMVDAQGLLVEGQKLLPFQAELAQHAGIASGWTLANPGHIGLMDVVVNAQPTVLVGVTGHPGLFTEEIVRRMARQVARPVILPLSNPTSRSEAVPADLVEWTEGRAIIGTGSPFPPVQIGARKVVVAQTNNAYVFPGVGLGTVAVQATQVTDGMFLAAAKALADASPAKLNPADSLLPPIESLRNVALRVAFAVGRQARRDGVAGNTEDDLEILIRARMWEPAYRTYRRAS